MEISGKIIAILPLQTGQGKNGSWRSQDFILETGDQYPKKVCINLFNDKIDKFPLVLNEAVTVSFDIESREYNGRWYTTARAWNVKKHTETTSERAPLPEEIPPPAQPQNYNNFLNDSPDADSGLPF